MPRNKKIKNDYYKKINLLARCDLYFKNNNKLPVSEDEYQHLKDEILILENRYPSIKKLSKSLILRGELKYDDGRIYSGAIKSAKEHVPHGHGFMRLNKADVSWNYMGEFKDGIYEGQGEFIAEGHYSYKGEWKNSFFHGKGKLTDEKLDEIYEGDFIDDKKHGYGISIFSNFSKYEGEFKKGKQNGKGKYTILKDFKGFEKGTIYEGNFKNDHLHGYCKITYPDGQVSDGTWNKGKFTKKRKK
mgnify:CR=1 FL=1|tara:strand:+ start:56 stop:787 length:732 start_codon:yes stop_codon:yes gene_type:complete